MCFEPHSYAAGQCCGGAIASIHLCGDAVKLVVVEPESEHCLHSLAGETSSTVPRVEDPPNFALVVLVIGEPQNYIPDRDALKLDDQRKRTILTIEAGLAQALGELVTGDFRGPRFVQQVTGNIWLRVQLVKPSGIVCVMQTEAQSLRRQGPLNARRKVASVVEQLLGASCRRSPDALLNQTEPRGRQAALRGSVLRERACSQESKTTVVCKTRCQFQRSTSMPCSPCIGMNPEPDLRSLGAHAEKHHGPYEPVRLCIGNCEDCQPTR